MNEIAIQNASRAASKDNKHLRLLEFKPNPIAGIVITLCVMSLLAFAVHIFNVPNPNMILISGLVVCSAVFGYYGGVPAAIVMFGYTLFFFSIDHSFLSFTEQNLQKVIVSAIGIVTVGFFVSYLRRTVTLAIGDLEELNDVLEEDNALLEHASTVDTLTNTRNRFALRNDFPHYTNQHLHVVMLDVDDFKDANDTYGHSAGDAVLHEIGQTLCEMCSQEHVYRYGGDEFLVICPEITTAEFKEKATELKDKIASIRIADSSDSVHFSAGYVYGTPSSEIDLRLMVRQADANLYNSKEAGKNRVSGSAFNRSVADQSDARRKTPTDRMEPAGQFRALG